MKTMLLSIVLSITSFTVGAQQEISYELSFQNAIHHEAVFADAGVATDETNKTNILTPYYNYSASVALALDLDLRAEFELAPDDYMRALWKAHGKFNTCNASIKR